MTSNQCLLLFQLFKTTPKQDGQFDMVQLNLNYRKLTTRVFNKSHAQTPFIKPILEKIFSLLKTRHGRFRQPYETQGRQGIKNFDLDWNSIQEAVEIVKTEAIPSSSSSQISGTTSTSSQINQTSQPIVQDITDKANDQLNQNASINGAEETQGDVITTAIDHQITEHNETNTHDNTSPDDSIYQYPESPPEPTDPQATNHFAQSIHLNSHNDTQDNQSQELTTKNGRQHDNKRLSSKFGRGVSNIKMHRNRDNKFKLLVEWKDSRVPREWMEYTELIREYPEATKTYLQHLQITKAKSYKYLINTYDEIAELMLGSDEV